MNQSRSLPQRTSDYIELFLKAISSDSLQEQRRKLVEYIGRAHPVLVPEFNKLLERVESKIRSIAERRNTRKFDERQRWVKTVAVLHELSIDHVRLLIGHMNGVCCPESKEWDKAEIVRWLSKKKLERLIAASDAVEVDLVRRLRNAKVMFRELARDEASQSAALQATRASWDASAKAEEVDDLRVDYSCDLGILGFESKYYE